MYFNYIFYWFICLFVYLLCEICRRPWVWKMESKATTALGPITPPRPSSGWTSIRPRLKESTQCLDSCSPLPLPSSTSSTGSLTRQNESIRRDNSTFCYKRFKKFTLFYFFTSKQGPIKPPLGPGAVHHSIFPHRHQKWKHFWYLSIINIYLNQSIFNPQITDLKYQI